MSKKKIGIALGGGAARGIAHIGVLEILEKEGIPIDMVAGTSAGAIIGALHASGMSALRMKEIVLGFDWKKRRHLVDFSIPHTGFIAGERLMQEMQRMIGGDIKFNELKKPFACVACDLLSGEEIVMTGGSVAEAVHASVSIPVIFQAVKRKGRFLIDGGLVNQVPVNVVKAMGADYIIAVNVVPRYIHKLQARLDDHGTLEGESGSRPNIISVMLSVIDIANSCRIEASLSGADMIIEPRMMQIGPADFHKAELSILQGKMAAIDAVLKIKRELTKN